MPKLTIETVDAITVNKRDGSTVDIDMTKIPESFFADFVTEGVAEYIRDSSSAALAYAFDIAHPNHKHEGVALKDARNKWVVDNVDAVAAESVALMTNARDRLYDGERRIARESTSDPMDQWRIKVLRAKMRQDAGVALKKAHDAINSADQTARRAFLLGVAAKNDWVESDAIDLRATSDAATAKLKEAKVVVTL